MQQNRRGARGLGGKGGLSRGRWVIGFGTRTVKACIDVEVLRPQRKAKKFRSLSFKFPGADVAVVPPWAQEGFGKFVGLSRRESLQPRQDTFTMPFPRKREGEAHRKRHQSLPEALMGAVDRGR